MSVEEVREKVRRILTDHFGSIRVDRDGDVLFEVDSAFGYVGVQDWRDGETIVKIKSFLLRDVDLTPEVYKWAAVEGQSRWFAHACVLVNPENPNQGMITWEYDLLGNSIDPDELVTCVVTVMGGANHMDDELQKRFGGRKGAD